MKLDKKCLGVTSSTERFFLLANAPALTLVISFKAQTATHPTGLLNVHKFKRELFRFKPDPQFRILVCITKRRLILRYGEEGCQQ